MELVPVTTATDIGLAAILRGMLESAGIEAVVQDIGLNSVYPNIPGLSGFQILVPEDDAARARDLLDQADENGVVDEEEEE
jgi:hypothetical protein